MKSQFNQFDYLLNALEYAAAQKDPHEAGYALKRSAVLDYVAQLPYSPDEWVELRKAISELAMAIGNPAVHAHGDQTIESQTIREAIRRIKEIEPSAAPKALTELLGDNK